MDGGKPLREIEEEVAQLWRSLEVLEKMGRTVEVEFTKDEIRYLETGPGRELLMTGGCDQADHVPGFRDREFPQDRFRHLRSDGKHQNIAIIHDSLVRLGDFDLGKLLGKASGNAGISRRDSDFFDW